MIVQPAILNLKELGFDGYEILKAILYPHIKEREKNTYRSIMLEIEEIEFSNGFTELHPKSFKNV